MNKYFLNRVMTLMAVPALAVTGLLLVFLLLGWSTVGATTPGGLARSPTFWLKAPLSLSQEP